MSKAYASWTVLDHGPIEKLAPNVWRVEGAIRGMSLRRVMTVARRGDGTLVVHNAIALREDAMKEIEAWGTPAFLLVPNGWHRLDAPAYKTRYPAMKVFAPAGSRKKVEEVLPVDGTFAEFPSDDVVRLAPLAGVNDAEGVMEVRSSDGVTLVLTDAVFNMDRKKDVMGFLVTTVLGSAPGPRVSRLAKLLMVKDKAALRADLERLAAMPELTRLIVAHEKVAAGPDAAQTLRQAATYL